MGLKDKLKELETQEAEALAALENETEIEEVEEVVEEPEVEEVQDEPKEEPKETPKEEVKTPSDYRKQRLEAKEKAERERQEREPAPVSVVQGEDSEPDPQTQPAAWLAWDNRQLRKELSQIRETVLPVIEDTKYERQLSAELGRLAGYENNYRKTNPQYDEAAAFMINDIARSTKRLHPHATDQQIANVVKEQMVAKFQSYEKMGLNPAEAAFDEALEWGYAPQVEEPKKNKPKTPDMSKLAANQTRNGGMIGTRGTGGETVNKNVALKPKEFARLTPEERKAYMSN